MTVLSPEQGHYFAGLADGEGCFQIRIQDDLSGPRSCSFTIGLRSDDEPLLVELREQCGGIGGLHRSDRSYIGSNPLSVWQIQSQTDCHALILIFDRYPLRSKKLRDYEIWKKGLAAFQRRDYGEMLRLRQQLREGRQYRETSFDISGPDWEQLILVSAYMTDTGE